MENKPVPLFCIEELLVLMQMLGFSITYITRNVATTFLWDIPNLEICIGTPCWCMPKTIIT